MTPSGTERRSSRGQTTIDFAIGAGIFLLVVGFVFAFIPGTFTPFVEAEQPQSADRVAAKLAGGELGSPAQPSLLDRECTAEFFEYFASDVTVTEDCRFDDETGSINEALGVSDLTNINVSIRHQNDTIRTIQHDGTDVQLAAGDVRPSSAATTTARRTVRLDGAVNRLVVSTW